MPKKPKVVFVFPGQGAQWAGMGRDLLAREPAFARHMHACARAVEAELGWSPVDILLAGRPMSRVQEIQPTLWAMQVALARLWREWGIEPDLLIGHSMGEIAAAVVSGALSLADGAAVVCRRSAVLDGLAAPGAMWAVGLGEKDAQEAIGTHAGQVCVGVVNSRYATVLSGDGAALEKVVEPLRRRGVFCRRVDVDYASHAPQVDPLREELIGTLRDIRPGAGEVPIHSSAWSRIVEGDELDAGYWFENLRLPVRFADAAQAALAEGRPTVFIEISPHPLLQSSLEDEIEACGATGAVVSSLDRAEPETDILSTALARVYALGCRPDWERLYPEAGYVPLPAYPWQWLNFWPDAPKSVLAPEHPPVAASTRPVRTDMAVLSENELAGVVAGLAAQVLAVPGHEIGIDVPLTLLGLDSVLASRFRDRMRKDLGVDVPIRQLLGSATLLELATELRSAAPVTTAASAGLAATSMASVVSVGARVGTRPYGVGGLVPGAWRWKWRYQHKAALGRAHEWPEDGAHGDCRVRGTDRLCPRDRGLGQRAAHGVHAARQAVAAGAGHIADVRLLHRRDRRPPAAVRPRAAARHVRSADRLHRGRDLVRRVLGRVRAAGGDAPARGGVGLQGAAARGLHDLPHPLHGRLRQAGTAGRQAGRARLQAG